MLTKVIMLAATIAAGCDSQPTAPAEVISVAPSNARQPDDRMSEFRASTLLLRALLDRDAPALMRFTEEPALFFSESGKLDASIQAFIYESEVGRILQRGRKVEDFSIKIIPQKENVFTVLFAQKNDRQNLDDVTFLETQWMKGYFACELRKRPEGGFVLNENFCFAETDGPFPPEIG